MMPRNGGPAAVARAGPGDGMLLPLPDVQRWRALAASGWQFLLPPPPFRRLVCYDNLDGATVLLAASLADDVLVVHHDQEHLGRLRALAEATSLRGVRFASIEDVLQPGEVGEVDGALVHDPEARVLRRDHRPGPALGALCARLAALLRPQGFLYLGLRNRFAYRHLRSLPGASARLLSAGAALRAVRRAGLFPAPPQPLLLEGARISEIIPRSGYRSAKNRFLPAERIRELLLRGWGRRHLAPAYAVVGFRGTTRPSWLERLATEPWVQSLAPGSALRRCVVLNEGKLMLSLGPARAPHGTLVLVVALDRRTAERRRVEGRWLRRLAALPPAIAGAIPVFHGEREIEGALVFALSERPGVTVDHDAPFLPRLTTTAARWLRDFHRATARPTEVHGALFGSAFSPLFEKARGRYPALSADLAALEELVRLRLSGQMLALGCLHGDFKLENVVFEERTGAIGGVIDWELAWEPGPPLLDLLYLLLYNRVVRGGTGVIEAAETTLVRGRWASEERAHLDAHHAALGSLPSQEAALGALFLVHHIGVRVTYDLAEEGTLRSLRFLLSTLRGQLAAPHSS